MRLLHGNDVRSQDCWWRITNYSLLITACTIEVFLLLCICATVGHVPIAGCIYMCTLCIVIMAVSVPFIRHGSWLLSRFYWDDDEINVRPLLCKEHAISWGTIQMVGVVTINGIRLGLPRKYFIISAITLTKKPHFHNAIPDLWEIWKLYGSKKSGVIFVRHTKEREAEIRSFWNGTIRENYW